MSCLGMKTELPGRWCLLHGIAHPFSTSSLSVLPSFIKTPHDITSRTGTTARLECAAEGHPPPQIAWQKDGGTDFPAARERRMHVMPDDDVFFITDVKIEDMGVYSCTAQNSAGSVLANATLTVLGKMPESPERLTALGAGPGRDCCRNGTKRLCSAFFLFVLLHCSYLVKNSLPVKKKEL